MLKFTFFLTYLFITPFKNCVTRTMKSLKLFFNRFLNKCSNLVNQDVHSILEALKSLIDSILFLIYES